MHKQFDVVLVSLDPTKGTEIKKTRPCVIVSPEELNKHLPRRIIAPLTSKSFDTPFRVPVTFNDTKARILLDQLRTIDQNRIIKPLGSIDTKTANKVKDVLVKMFS